MRCRPSHAATVLVLAGLTSFSSALTGMLPPAAALPAPPALSGPASAASATTVVADWRMGQAPGSTRMIDSSGQGNTGVIEPGVELGLPGVSGWSYGFTGNGAHVSVASRAALDPDARPFSYAVSYRSSTRPTVAVGDYDVIRKGTGTAAGGDWKMEVEQDGAASCTVRGTSRTVVLIGSTDVVDGSWHALQCRTTRTTVQLLVDGVVQSHSARGPGNVSNDEPITIGAKPGGGDATTGQLDELVITKG